MRSNINHAGTTTCTRTVTLKVSGLACAGLLADTTPKAIRQVDGKVLPGRVALRIAAWHVVRHRALVVPRLTRLEPPVHLEDLEVEAQDRGAPPYADAFVHAIRLREALGAATNVDIPCVARETRI